LVDADSGAGNEGQAFGLYGLRRRSQRKCPGKRRWVYRYAAETRCLDGISLWGVTAVFRSDSIGSHARPWRCDNSEACPISR
jgi:hypothetical protein